MTKEELAQQLNGREYTQEVTPGLITQATAAGLVIVFGGSDDLIEFRGTINDEAGAPGTVLIDQQGLLPDRSSCNWVSHSDAEVEAFFHRRLSAKTIEALWCEEEPYSFTYRTDISHATFDILEDGEKYCRGIVFSLADL